MRFTRIAVIIALLLILLIVVISYLYWNHPDKRVDLSNYFTVLAGFSIIVLVVTFVLNSHLRDQEANDKTREAHASLRRRLYDKAIAPFIDHYPHLNRLYSQIYPEQVTTTSSTDPEKAQLLEQAMVSELLRIMEEVVQLNRTGAWEGDWASWYELFSAWLGSEIVRDYWDSNRRFYDSGLARFIDSAIRSNK